MTRKNFYEIQALKMKPKVSFLAKALLTITNEEMMEKLLSDIFLDYGYQNNRSQSNYFISKILALCSAGCLNENVEHLGEDAIEETVGNPALGLEKSIKILLAIYKKAKLVSKWVSRRYVEIVEKIGIKILDSKSFQEIEPALDCLDVSWAIVGNKNTPKTVALELFQKTKLAFDKGEIATEFVALLALYGSSRFLNEAFELAKLTTNLDDVGLALLHMHALPETDVSRRINKRINNLSSRMIEKLASVCVKKAMFVRCRRTPSKILEENFASIDSRYLWQSSLRTWDYLEHPSCTEKLFDMVWSKAKNEINNYERLLKCEHLTKNVANDILVMYADDVKFMKKHKLKFAKFLGHDTVNGYIAAAKLLR